MADLLPPIIATLKADISDFDSKMGRAITSVNRMQERGSSGFDQLAHVGKVAFGTLSTAAVAFGAFAVKQAAEQEEANARLTTSLHNVGSQLTATSKPVEDLSQRLIKLGFDDAQTADSLAKLTTATKNPATAMRDVALAADIARGRHIDLASATDLLTKVETGHVALLGRIGIATKDASGATISQAEAIQRLSGLYGGQAAAYTGTFAGKMAVLHAEVNELGESVGNLLIPVIEKSAHELGVGANYLAQHTGLAKTLAAVVGGPLVLAMGAYIAAQTKSVALTALQTAERLPQAMLALGAAIRGTTAEEVVLNETTAATNATMLLGVGAVAGFAAILGVAYARQQQVTEAANHMAAAFVKGLPAGADKIQALNDKIKELENRPFWKNIGPWDSQRVNRDIAAYKAQRDALTDSTAATAGLSGAMGGVAATAGEADAGLDGLDQTAKEATQALDGLKQDTMGLFNAQKSLADASRTVNDDQQRLGDSNAALNALLRQGAVDTKAVASAQRELETATRSVADSQDRLTEARKAFDTLVAGPKPRDVTDANLKISETTDGVTKAQIRLREANANLVKVQGDNKSTADDVTSAQLEVHDATRGVTEAMEQADDAQKALNDLMSAGKEGSDQYTTARKGVTDAEQALKDAQDQQATAVAQLQKAQAGDPDFSHKVADAKRAQSDAEKAVADAKGNVAAQTLALYDAQQKESTALADGGQAALAYLTYLQGIVDLYPQLASDPLLAVLRGLVSPTAEKEGNVTRFGRPHAAGGPVSAGVLYPINDSASRAVEGFMPDQGGTIVPLGPTGGGGVGTVTIVVPVTIDGREVARVLAPYTEAELLKSSSRNGRGRAVS